jgi:ATP-dependent Lon protease
MKSDFINKPGNASEEISAALYQRSELLYEIPNSSLNADGLIECPGIILNDIIVFPRLVSPIFISPGKNLSAILEAQDKSQTIITLFPKSQKTKSENKESYLPVAVEAAIGQLLDISEGNNSALLQGRRRVEIVDVLIEGQYLRVIAKPYIEPAHADRVTKALMRTTRGLFENCVQHDRSLPDEANILSININEPGWLADMVATAISPSLENKKELISILNPKERLTFLNTLLAQELDVLLLEENIQTKVQKEVDKSQREFYLREQIKAIQGELGEGDIWEQEILNYREKIKERKLPKEISFIALKEVEKLSNGSSLSPEVGIIRNYLDWILDLPWNKFTKDNLSVNHATRILKKNHFGLQKAKERIIEYIAVKSLKPENLKQPILCFIGPPGTGKTSLGKSIAEALGRKFVRISLGGVRDEAEIRGHRRTYIGALPGRIIQTIKRAEIMNPLFMLDEVDKIGTDFRGDPSAALLEVLDPEQNYAFSDHYLEVAFDLSNVMFITTANSTENIPAALLDRMEVIEFPGYIEEEKIEIARRFLIPKQKIENGLVAEDFELESSALIKIIRDYTFEAGVRNLEREIGRLCRKISRKKSENKNIPKSITTPYMASILGPSQYFSFEAESEDEVGVGTAVAWTENGGEIMPVEILTFEGKGNMQITGQVGEIMQESAQAALSYLKSKAKAFQIENDIFEKVDIHIHIPEGAIPKDGPSAGVTIATALVSAFTKRKVHKEIGMTGEITLRGKVLQVGGIREKVLAAHRAGLKKVILPKNNMKDLIDIPRKAIKELTIIPVEHIDEILRIALYPK